MKTVIKILTGILLTVAAAVLLAMSWLGLRPPAQRPATTEKFESTPARLARGEYLVLHVTDCLGCHSDHVENRFGFPVKPGSEGQGGFVFDKKLGIPGVVAAQNITPDRETGIGGWSDDEVLRAIREGVDRNGAALFPMMPYVHFSHLNDEDAKSIIVYLRTLKPIHNQVSAKHIDFPVNLFIKMTPKPIVAPVSSPDPRTDHHGYGKYLVTIGGCYECHTPHNAKNALIAEKAFTGGWEMRGPWGRNLTANLTPATDTFMGHATREQFIGRFRAFAKLNASNSPSCPSGRNTIMPWLAFSTMSDDDLTAIYDYLRSLPPMGKAINSFPDSGSGKAGVISEGNFKWVDEAPVTMIVTR